MRKNLRGTPNLNHILRGNLDKKFHEQVWTSLNDTRALLFRKPMGEERAHEAFAVMNFMLEDALKARADKKEPVSCKQGCSACCYKKVEIGPSEARAIVEFMIEEKVPFDHAHMKKQAEHDKLDDGAYWQLPKEERRCPFLSDKGECNVYAVRPMNCRKYVVLSEPELCASPEGNAKVKVALHTNMEILTSALMDLEKDFGGILAKKVLQAIEGKEAVK